MQTHFEIDFNFFFFFRERSDGCKTFDCDGYILFNCDGYILSLIVMVIYSLIMMVIYSLIVNFPQLEHVKFILISGNFLTFLFTLKNTSRCNNQKVKRN